MNTFSKASSYCSYPDFLNVVQEGRAVLYGLEQWTLTYYSHYDRNVLYTNHETIS